VVALAEFNMWCTAFEKFVRACDSADRKLKLRFFVGDFCTEFCPSVREMENPSEFLLFGECFNPQLRPRQFDTSDIPHYFNVVDGSDLIDNVGLISYLVSVIPLLEFSPATVVYTDTYAFIPDGKEKETDLLEQLLCGSVPMMCSLLGISPLSYITGVGTGDQIELSVPSGNVFNRIVWKFTVTGDTAAKSHPALNCHSSDFPYLDIKNCTVLTSSNVT
jgi:hypothetical protein